MKSVRTFFYSVDNTKNGKNIFFDVDETLDKTLETYKDVFEILDRAKAKPSEKIMDKIFSEIS